MTENRPGAMPTVTRTLRVSVSFDVDDYAALKRIAQAKRVSAAWVVRDAVTNYLNAQVPLFASDGPGTRIEMPGLP